MQWTHTLVSGLDASIFSALLWLGHTTPIYLEYLHQLESQMQEVKLLHAMNDLTLWLFCQVRAFEQNCKQHEAYLAHLEAYQQQLEAHKRDFPGFLDRPILDPISPETPTNVNFH